MISENRGLSSPSPSASRLHESSWRKNQQKLSSLLNLFLPSTILLIGALLGGIVLGVTLVETHRKTCHLDDNDNGTAEAPWLCRILPAQEGLLSERGGIVPVDHANGQLHSGLVVGSNDSNRTNDMDAVVSRVGPIVLEVGVVAVLHALGVGAWNRLLATGGAGNVLKTMFATDALRRCLVKLSLSTPFKTAVKWYKKTAASKVVTRVKKQIKQTKKEQKKQAKRQDQQEQVEEEEEDLGTE